ncbi:hypothetical protein EOM39_02315 [Candidatus Gracilibacteria bacterium]|nr:hypothetical protein [Candidatus Gracilibacteria bacterium]
MKYHFKSLKQILDVFETNEIIGATEISIKLGKSRTIIHKYLKELVKQKKLKKVGNGPLTKYKIVNTELSTNNSLESNNTLNSDFLPDYKTTKTLEDIFYKFTPEGRILIGFNGLKEWCSERNLDVEEKVVNYISIYNHIQSLQDDCGLLKAKDTFGKHFEKVYLDNVYYADQYKRMEFGRGKLAEMTFYAKTSQNKELINQSINEIILKLECFIKKEKFDAIAITPWSIDRKNQLLQFLKNELKGLQIPFVNVIKYYANNIAIPQKSLKTREQRIQNARNTIFVDDKNIGKYKKVLLIDDFVGSGSTLNETASKLKKEGVNIVYGFAFVGNLNLEYEVINEV